MSSSSNESPETSSAVACGAGNEAVPSRRRLFKQGAAVVAATLASRPVLAWHCNTPSAWGSLQQPGGNVGSMATKHAAEQLADETWTIANWKVTNSTRAGLAYPWVALGTDISNTSATNYYKKYKISTLFSGLTIPPGLNPDDSVWKRLVGTTTTPQASLFNQFMIVARLNYKLITNVRLCLTSDSITQLGDQLNLMVSGTYTPPGFSMPWDQAKIMDYLSNNYIVRTA